MGPFRDRTEFAPLPTPETESSVPSIPASKQDYRRTARLSRVGRNVHRVRAFDYQECVKNLLDLVESFIKYKQTDLQSRQITRSTGPRARRRRAQDTGSPPQDVSRGGLLPPRSFTSPGSSLKHSSFRFLLTFILEFSRKLPKFDGKFLRFFFAKI